MQKPPERLQLYLQRVAAVPIWLKENLLPGSTGDGSYHTHKAASAGKEKYFWCCQSSHTREIEDWPRKTGKEWRMVTSSQAWFPGRVQSLFKLRHTISEWRQDHRQW
jgi:hypothetical protein